MFLTPIRTQLLPWARTHLLPWLRAQRLQLLVLFLGVLLPLWIFGELADNVLENEGFFFDKPVLLFLHNHATPWLDSLMQAMSLLGYMYGVIPVALLVPLVLLGLRRWRDTFFWALAIGGSAALNLAAKQLFERVRPDFWQSLAPETTFSFPSGHAMGSMSLVAALVVLVWASRWRWPTLLVGGLFVLLVGLSRMYLGVHYPSDVLAGWAASLAWVIGANELVYQGSTIARAVSAAKRVVLRVQQR